MIKKGWLLGSVAAAALALPSQAAVITQTYSGIVRSGSDDNAVFGTRGTNLAGSPFTAVVKIDDQATNVFRYENKDRISFSTANYSRNANFITYSFTVNGRTVFGTSSYVGAATTFSDMRSSLANMEFDRFSDANGARLEHNANFAIGALLPAGHSLDINEQFMSAASPADLAAEYTNYQSRFWDRTTNISTGYTSTTTELLLDTLHFASTSTSSTQLPPTPSPSPSPAPSQTPLITAEQKAKALAHAERLEEQVDNYNKAAIFSGKNKQEILDNASLYVFQSSMVELGVSRDSLSKISDALSAIAIFAAAKAGSFLTAVAESLAVSASMVAKISRDIAKDPPDANFKLIADASVTHVPLTGTGISIDELAFYQAVVDKNLDYAGLQRALLISAERHDGAVLAGDQDSAKMQLDAFQLYLTRSSALEIELNQQYEAFGKRYFDSLPASDAGDIDLLRSAISAACDRGLDSGLQSTLIAAGGSGATKDINACQNANATTLPVRNAALFSNTFVTSATAVPEPKTWALMLIGFFAAAAGLRRQSGQLRWSASFRMR